MKLKLKKLNPLAQIPVKGRAEDACFDLYSVEDVTLEPGFTAVVSTGIAIDIPTGYFGKLYTRSGMARRGFATDGGVIDAGYQGDIGVIIRNISHSNLSIVKGDRIAQMAIHKVEEVDGFEEVEDFDRETERGDAGYGSSGK